MADELATLRAAHGLPPDPATAMPFRYLHLACEPPGLWPPEDPPAPTSHLLRPEPFDRTGDEGLPDWVAALGDAPTVCATLGTFMNRSAEVFRAILDGLRDEGLNVVLTVGRDQDPAQFGPQPANVRIERYIPLSLLLAPLRPGGLPGGLQHGRHGAAARPAAGACSRSGRTSRWWRGRWPGCGWGRCSARTERTPEAIRGAVRAVLADPAYRDAPSRCGTRMAALPGPEHAVALLERLAAEQQPLLTA